MTQQSEVPPHIPEKAEAPAAKQPRGSFLHATLWTLGGEASSHVLRVISSMILTRLLFPEDFGLMAVVQVFMQGLTMFSDLGIRPIIIRHERGGDPSFLNTMWTVRLIRGIVLAAIFCAIAWPVSKFYGRPLLAAILPVASLNLLLEGFQSTKIFSHERRLYRARLTMVSLTSLFAGIVFMVAWAWMYRSVWALVWGGVVGSVVRVFLSHVALPGPGNRFQWDRAAWREVSHFGKWVFLNSMVTFLAMQMDKLVFAKLIPLSTLGFYAIAVNIVQLPTAAVRAVATSVVFPALSEARTRLGDLAATYDRMRLYLLLAGGAGVSFLVLNGPWLIALLYDPRYEAAGWILQIVAFGAWFIVLETAPGFLILALGHPRWLTVASAAKIGAWVIAVPFAFLHYGFPGALAGVALVEIVRFGIESARVRKAGVHYRRYELATSALVLACGAAGLLIQHKILKHESLALRGLVSSATFMTAWVPVGLWCLRKVKKAG